MMYFNRLSSRAAVLRFSFALAIAFSFVGGAEADTILSKAPTDFFIRFEKNVSREEATRIARSNQFRIVWESRLVPGLVRVVPTSRAGLTPGSNSVVSIRSNPRVRYFEPNYRSYRRLAPRPSQRPLRYLRSNLPDVDGPSDPRLQEQWALTGEHGIHPAGAWRVTKGDARVRVAILDTGIEMDHPELADRVVPGYDFIDRTPVMRDRHGHGTHVSGVIGARWDNAEGIAGINRDVSLIPVRVVPDQGDETDADVIEGFEFAVAQGARVANCSFGKQESSQAVGDVIEAAGKRGLFVVVAAGNDSSDLNRRPSYPANFQTSNMIVVAATSASGHIANFSNYGLGKVDVGAPGANILSTVTRGRYASWNGTSMAAPQVTGVAALVLSLNPSLTPAQLREIMIRSVDRKETMKGRIDTGGVVNAAKAVRLAESLTKSLRRR